MNRVAIMQPTYLPWIGYFALMARVDNFVFLDSVQFDRRSWQQRNRIIGANGPMWLTVPVLSKGRRGQLICDVEIDKTRDFPGSHIRSIEMNYKKTPHFDTYAPAIIAILEAGHERLADLDCDLITHISGLLDIHTKTVRTSTMPANESSKADLLVDICKQLAADAYLSPPGSRDYLDQSNAFTKAGITLSYHEYSHPDYVQRSTPFVPYMSVIDLLFSCGPQSRAVLLGEEGG